MHHFWINDTVNFAINEDGELTNNSYLEIGEYYLTIHAFDPYGHYCEVDITITVVDTTAPTLGELPEEILAEYGDDFEYAIVASDLSGIDHFYISDNTNFIVSEEGVITNLIALSIGEYDIDIQVYDVYMNYVNGSTTITIADTTGPIFTDPPTRIDLEYGEALSYQFEATDLSGIDRFEMDAFGVMSMSDSGLLTNTTVLHAGIWEFDIQVFDTLGNGASHRIIVQVAEPSTTPVQDDQMLIVIIALGGIAAVVVVIVLLKRR